MDLLSLGSYNLRNVDRQNIILGKNGCGKSRLLKAAEEALRRLPTMGAVRYISPERAGTLQYEAQVEHNFVSAPSWLADTRRQNQAPQFRQQSAVQFRRLELLVLRDIEKSVALHQDISQTFDTTVERINKLLDRVYLERGDPSFVIKDRKTNQLIGASEVSSGESELISLGIECLVFIREAKPGLSNVLLLDEPDVHLHPDLQARFGRFLHGLLAEAPICLILATHSTAFLGAAPQSVSTRIVFMRAGDTDLTFKPIDEIHKRILPVFGAHPLSNVFNEAPVLLVEGEDDERVWQQAVRSAEGKIAVYPVAVDSVANLSIYEQEVATILQAVYDDAVGFSLRDRDDNMTVLDDVGPVRRFRLNCREAENLLLTDDALAQAGCDWSALRTNIVTWVASNASHPHFAPMKAFVDGGYDRRNAHLKEIRNDMVGLMGSNMPWEVVVGKAIAAVAKGRGTTSPDAMRDYLGAVVCREILQVSET